ncbi:sucrase ferredoxin [Actinokineospora sp. HUAS TT18]|uniref:sucrase ferredoxin n=1 Tax=Actinokineospora sp. HUAS TT18 TaxID=3447451 RepID=UPI003F526317
MRVLHPMATTLPDTACSALSRALNEPLAGTAATATTWLCLDQPGPWGRDALVDSHLDHAVGAELVARTKGTGVRVVLIRRPGMHPDRHVSGPTRIYAAHTAPGRTSLRHATVAEPKDLLDLDFTALGAGNLDGFGELVAGPLLLVCTNGRRDVCCAVRGRPIAEELAFDHGDTVWECTHIGGHRFAPTALLLPTGYSYGAIDTDFARGLLTDGVVTDRSRGRSTWPAAGQAAELAVRTHFDITDPDALTVHPGERWTVTHTDGRTWRVEVTEHTAGPDRPASCGALPGPAITHTVDRIT